MPRAADKRPVTDTDLFKFTWVGDPQISPDGSTVVFVRVVVNEKEDRERFLRQLYYLGYDEQKILTEIGKSDWNFFAGLFPYERLSPVITGN